MIQAIAGISPLETQEVTVMTVWPSNSMFRIGRWLGRAYSIGAGGYILTVGNLLALLSIPLALVLYFLRIAPGIGTRYTLTNRRVIVQKGLRGVDDHWVELDRFDSIEVVVQPGQEWYSAGDLIFLRDGIETLRLEAVSRPESFRQVCLKAHHAYVGVKSAMARAAVPV